MAQPVSPLAAYNDLINQQIAQYSQPRGSDLDPLTMLAVAQGFLSPTRTGSFGESVGNAAGMAIGPLSKARAADQDRMDKIARLRETQVKLALEQQRINDLNARAAAGTGDPILDYSRAMAGLEREAAMIGDPNALDIDTSTEEGRAEKARRMQDRTAITNQMKALRSRYFSGAGAGAAPKGDTGEGDGTEAKRPAAQPGPSGAAPAQAGKAGRIASKDDIKNARDAYDRGASIDAIIKRFKDNGITGITAEDITGGK